MRRNQAVSASFLLLVLVSSVSLLLLLSTDTVAVVEAAAKKQQQHNQNQIPVTESTAATTTTAINDYDGDDDDDDVIEVNPNYNNDLPGADANDDSGESGSDDDNESDGEEKEDCVSAKKSISKALKKTRKKKGLFKKAEKVVDFCKKNQRLIGIVIVTVAFRREIWTFFLKKISYQKLTFTDGLKLIIFVEVIRRLQAGRGFPFSNSGGGTPSSAFLAFLMRSNPILGLLLSTFTPQSSSNYNPAFVPKIDQHYAFERLNEFYVKDGMALQKSIQSKPEKAGLIWPDSPSSRMHMKSSSKTDASKNSSSNSLNSGTVVVIDWTSLSSSLPNLDVLRDQVSFLMSEYRRMAQQQEQQPHNRTETETTTTTTTTTTNLEVVVLLESPGGEVGAYGLAASQLLRLRNAPGIKLTICVDKIAASGGYMLACTASDGQLLAAPFALVGSIGVIGQIFNVQDLLENWGIKPLVFRGGKDKVPVGLVGEITDEGKMKTQEMINATHRAFRRHVLGCRPVLSDHTEVIGNGDVWLAMDGIGLGLVDQIKSSDEYIGEKVENGHRVLKMLRLVKKPGAFGTTSTYLTTSVAEDNICQHDQNYLTSIMIPSSLINLRAAKTWMEKVLVGTFGSRTIPWKMSSSSALAQSP
jgi:serine protease SohB